MKLFKHSALTAVLLVLSGTSYAVDTLNVKQLQRLCADPSSDEACSFYLRGFLDGAIATDPKVTMNVARALEDESLTGRAYRTRLGPRMDRYGPSYFAEFCVGESVPLAAVREALRLAINNATSAEQPARDFVYQVLRDSYACPST